MSNAVLKNIAYLTMLTDHFFAIVFTEVMKRYAAAGNETDGLRQVYSAGRAIGRIAFVLFAYLAVEGFIHTRSRKKYLLRLGTFAFVSEVPFDLAFSKKIIDWNSQNVFFTLFLGVLVLTIWEWGANNIGMLKRRRGRRDLCWYVCVAVFEAVRFGAVILCCVAAFCMRTDYKYMGVLLIFGFYLTREKGLFLKMAVAGFVMLFGMWSVNCLKYADAYSTMYLFRFSLREMYGLAAFVPIALYDGRIGRQLPKAVCYGFYPVHLLVLHGIAQIVVRSQ